MYYWRVFLWEDGQKVQEYTEHTIAPIFIEDRLDETLDTGEIILENMPIATRRAFPPKTKFRLERYITKDYTDEPRKYDLVVEHDDVEEYVGCADICTHRIHLIEASVIAQGMHVDNIALTYELQDVTLNYKTILSKTDTLGDLNALIKSDAGYPSLVRSNPSMALGTVYFQHSYGYIWNGWEELKTLLYEQDARTARTINFTIPTLTAQASYDGVNWSNLFEMETNTTVIKRHWRGSQLLGEVQILTRKCGPVTLPKNTKNEAYGTNIGSWIGGAPPDAPMLALLTRISPFTSRDSGLLISLNNLDKFSDHYTTSLYTVEMSKETPSGDNKSASFATDILPEKQLEDGEKYTYEIKCMAAKAKIPTFYTSACDVWETTGPAAYNNSTRGSQGEVTYIQGDQLPYISATTNYVDLSTDTEGGSFLARATQYNCHDLLRKVLLTIDTQVFNNSQIGLAEIQYSIVVDDNWVNRLKGQSMYETVLENKNLWEVLLQIGYYLHAIPYLEFAEDGTDRLVLKFRQLGATNVKANTSTKITVFNSQNLSEYFTQYDSYVTNLFSPQNEVDEWLTTKTSDRSYLISNNTANLQTKVPIQEILEFDITYKGKTASALDYIFEKSIYSILNTSTKVRPSKAISLFYTLGDNKIEGLNFTPPSVNNDAPYALKSILVALFGSSVISVINNIMFNDILFHIKYRTQDSLRISQIRPDIENFMKNSPYEKYPHHEQFYGQQDKIVDSERFSANLWGKLIRVGNAIFQCQEYAQAGEEKESGDLVVINSNPYYVTEIDNEFYSDAIFQKVTYSKNFNQLANIVTIPSEPRFYEVSEQSQVRREVRLMDFFALSATQNTNNNSTIFINNNRWKEFVKNLLFANKGNPILPNFAYTRFKADTKRQHIGSYGQIMPVETLFPSVEVTSNYENAVVPKSSSDHRDVIVPLLHFPLRNAIVFEWNMDDNFKAGDSTNTDVSGKVEIVDEAYNSLQPVRYCDIMGRADLFSFKLFNKNNWTIEQAQRLPFTESNDFRPTDEQSEILLTDSLAIGLDKDNREALSFNYQINLTQKDPSFVTFSNLFGNKNSKLKMCLLNKEVSMFDEAVSIVDAVTIADNVTYQLLDTGNAIELSITKPSNIDMNQVKSIVVYDQDAYNSKFAYIARNIGNVSNENKLQSWWIHPIYNS